MQTPFATGAATEGPAGTPGPAAAAAAAANGADPAPAPAARQPAFDPLDPNPQNNPNHLKRQQAIERRQNRQNQQAAAVAGAGDATGAQQNSATPQFPGAMYGAFPPTPWGANPQQMPPFQPFQPQQQAAPQPSPENPAGDAAAAAPAEDGQMPKTGPTRAPATVSAVPTAIPSESHKFVPTSLLVQRRRHAAAQKPSIKVLKAKRLRAKKEAEAAAAAAAAAAAEKSKKQTAGKVTDQYDSFMAEMEALGALAEKEDPEE